MAKQLTLEEFQILALDLISKAEVARLLGSTNTMLVTRLVERGQLPVAVTLQLGVGNRQGYKMYRRSAVLKLKQAQRRRRTKGGYFVKKKTH